MISNADFDFIRTIVRDRSAIVLEADKRYLIETRLQGLVHKEGLSTISELIGRIRQRDEEMERKVIETMTTNETLFFRDTHPFETLQQHILPNLIAARRETKTLQIWSGACSSGQEPYSLLILLREHFPSLQHWRINILATDLSNDILNKARAGRYAPHEVSRGLSPQMLSKYFDKLDSGWQIKRELRSVIEFRQFNLCKSWPRLPLMDLIFVRNVLIYFDVETKREILGRIRNVLHEDGYLFLGSTETTLNLDDGFVPVTHGRTVYYQHKDRDSLNLK